MSPLLMALLATLATWAATAAGAAAVFLVPKSMPWRHQRTLLDGSLGFAGGVMLAATYWGLLGPAMEQAQHSGIYGRHGWAPPAIGLILGAALVALADRCLPHAKSTSDGGVEAAAIATVAAHSNELQAPPHDSPLQDETDHTAAAGSASAADATTAAVTAAHQLPPRSLQVMAQHAPHLNSDECREVKLDTDGMEGREAGVDEAATADTKGAAGADETASEAHATTQRNNRTRPTVYKIKVSTEQPADLDSAAVKSTPVGTPKTPLALSQLERDASWRRLMLIVMAVTLHNLPEGLGVGVTFGALSSAHRDLPRSDHASYDHKLAAARSLTIAIGLQDIVEGLAVSLPLLRLGMSRRRAFFFGQLSGMAEPVGGVVGALAVSYLEPLLPYALALAGGAMLFVVMHDLIPETRQRGGSPNLACWALVIGFAIMMSLDAGL